MDGCVPAPGNCPKRYLSGATAATIRSSGDRPPQRADRLGGPRRGPTAAAALPGGLAGEEKPFRVGARRTSSCPEGSRGAFLPRPRAVVAPAPHTPVQQVVAATATTDLIVTATNFAGTGPTAGQPIGPPTATRSRPQTPASASPSMARASPAAALTAAARAGRRDQARRSRADGRRRRSRRPRTPETIAITEPIPTGSISGTADGTVNSDESAYIRLAEPEVMKDE